MAGEKILIVDDDVSVCKVISRVVSSKGMQPSMAHSGEEAIRLLEGNGYDLVVLDLTLGEVDGWEVLEQIRGRKLDVPVIILSGNSESYNKLLGLESGADDYMTKPFDPAFLAAKIQALIRRDQRRSTSASAILATGELSYNPATMKLLRNGEDVPLSTKEHAMLRVFMESKGQAFTKDELYRKVWDDDKTDENAIMVYISRLRGKIEPDPKNPRYILTVWGKGYKFTDED